MKEAHLFYCTAEFLVQHPWLLNSIYFADKEKIDCGTVRNPKMTIELEGEASHVYAKNNYSCRARSISNVFTLDDAMVDCANDVKVKNVHTWYPTRFTDASFHLTY